MCARGDEEWRKYLLRIGDGTEPVCETVSPFAIRVPDKILAPREWSHAELARHIFPDLAAATTQSSQPNCPSELLDFWKERAVLTATNAVVDEVNRDMLGELPRETLVTYPCRRGGGQYS